MDDAQQKIKEHFANNFKAEEYFAELNNLWKKEAPDLFRYMLVFIHNVFKSKRFKGSKLLEIGSGATVHSIAAASAYFPNIVMSDFVEDNREHLKRWLSGESNLRQFLDIPAELEGYGDDLEAGRRMLGDRIRKAVKRVCSCDVLVDGILLDNDDTADTSPSFDVIISCLCLVVAPKDLEGYYKTLKRVSSLLRPGGGLIICEFLRSTLWNVGEKWFPCIQFGEEEILEGLTKAGFGKIELKTLRNDGNKDIRFIYDKVFCAAAEKL